jgi:hypothetical protein
VEGGVVGLLDGGPFRPEDAISNESPTSICLGVKQLSDSGDIAGKWSDRYRSAPLIEVVKQAVAEVRVGMMLDQPGSGFSNIVVPYLSDCRELALNGMVN